LLKNYALILEFAHEKCLLASILGFTRTKVDIQIDNWIAVTIGINPAQCDYEYLSSIHIEEKNIFLH